VGSVRLVVDSANGAIAQRIDYDEFGRVQNDTSPGFQPFGFAGGLYDADTGLVRFGARDCDPSVGRWISKDPILFNGAQANLYVYVGNDPVNASDSSGLGPVEVARCLESGYSLSECLNSERQLACRNWGILCDGDQPSPAGPVFPPKPANDNGGGCRENIYKCLENPWQPPDTCSEFGPRKDCGACGRFCETNGYWPYDKCPL